MTIFIECWNLNQMHNYNVYAQQHKDMFWEVNQGRIEAGGRFPLFSSAIRKERSFSNADSSVVVCRRQLFN